MLFSLIVVVVQAELWSIVVLMDCYCESIGD